MNFRNIVIYSYSYYSPIKIKVVPDEYKSKRSLGYEASKGFFLIHSKVFVIDNKIAYVGSVNYTHKGFVSNYETMVKVTSKRAVEEISKEVDRLYRDKSVSSIDLEDWGKELYTEEPN